MRIISGFLGGRRFHPPTSLPVRPTTDMAREGLFNVLRHRINFEDLVVLDLFSGTGSVAFECISRGAKHVTVVEKHPKAANFITTTAQQFELSNLLTLQIDVFVFLGRTRETFDLIFADPPYDLKQIPLLTQLIFDQHLLNPGGYFILEHSRDYQFADHPNFVHHRKYGKVNFSFFCNE